MGIEHSEHNWIPLRPEGLRNPFLFDTIAADFSPEILGT